MNISISSMMTKLKPVVYTTSTIKRGAPETTQQIVLLKALQVTQDPKELRKMMGVRTVAEVYRTLDKLQMRKEYHDALARSGISFDYVVQGLKDVADGAEKDADKIKALQTILKSLGMDKYDDTQVSSGTWEEELLKSLEKRQSPQLPAAQQALAAPAPLEQDYEVAIPETPDSVKKLREEEEAITKGIYE